MKQVWAIRSFKINGGYCSKGRQTKHSCIGTFLVYKGKALRSKLPMRLALYELALSCMDGKWLGAGRKRLSLYYDKKWVFWPKNRVFKVEQRFSVEGKMDF